MGFHTTDVLIPLIDRFTHVKIDIEWAGYCVFLAHPSYMAPPRAAVKAEILQHAKDLDKVFIPQGPGLKDTGVSYSELLKEFAGFSLEMIAHGRCLTIELTVLETDPNCAFALESLKELGIDIFGKHREHFYFQGGLTRAKVFPPELLVADAAVG